MNRFSRFPLRWSLFIGLFILTFSLTIRHIVNGQGDGEKGFRLRLSEGRKNAPPSPTPTIAAPPSSQLPDDATQNLLKRLPAITAAADDKKDFAIRERSLPPPRTGRVSDEPFPPVAISGAPADPVAGPLEVLRFSPEGEVQLAPHLSVTFSQPMVAVASNEDLAASQPRDPILFVEFDQKIDHASLLKHIGLRAGGREWPLRLATDQEIANDEEIKERVAK